MKFGFVPQTAHKNWFQGKKKNSNRFLVDDLNATAKSDFTVTLSLSNAIPAFGPIATTFYLFPNKQRTDSLCC